MRYPKLALWLLAVAWIAGPGHVAIGAEPAEAFLQGLQDRGLNDMAMAYIEQMQSSRLCPSEFKKAIDYKAGIVLMAGAGSIRSIPEQAKRLDAARGRFEKFLAEHADHELASSATAQLANVLVERGRMLVDESGRPSKTAADKKRLLDRARGLYGEAKAVFVKAEKHYSAILKTMPTGLIDRKNVKEIEARAGVRIDLMESRLLIGTVIYETAMTYPAGSKQRKEMLNEAAAKYKSLHEKYSPRLHGLYARMWEGRCYKELGDHKKALRIYDELLARQEDEPLIHRLKNKALILSLETSMQPNVNLYKPAIDNFNDWLQSSRGNEQSSKDGLAIKYLAGGAYLEYARGMDEKDQKRREPIARARKLLRFVSRFPGNYQREARLKLADPLLGGVAGDKDGEPATFVEACERGRAALDRMQALETQDKLDQSRGKTENHERNVKEIDGLRAEAMKYYRMALGMVSPQTSVEDVNLARHYLTYLYLLANDTYRAAVLGEFLATRYPNSAGARQSAQFAMVAYARLYNRAKAGSPAQEFGNRHMVAMAEYITQRWPNSPEASDAWMMLLHIAVRGGKLPAASDLLGKLPAESSRRGEAELMVGRAYWADYLRSQRLEESARPSQDEQVKKMAEAKCLLAAGIEHSAGRRIDASLFASVLSLAQIQLRDGSPDEAVKLLDDPKIGAHTLLMKKHPAAAQSGYDIKTYKTALRAYVANRNLDKAEKTMDDLEKAVAAEGDAQAASKLTRIYISLGRELQELLEGLRKQDKGEQLQAVSGGFELFLNRISQRQQGNTFNSLNWVAETFFGMGAGFDPGSRSLPPQAEKYYEKAAQTYRIILKKCKEDETFAPRKDAVYGIRIRLAKCLLKLGQYEKAMRYLLSVLVHRNMMIDAQVQAAYTYQAWAATPGNSRRYKSAIRGGYRSKKTKTNVVWGWQKIAKMAASSKKHAAIFHEARYNLSLCQMKLALMLRGQKRKDALNSAAKSIARLQILYPKMGGPGWQKKYDALLKKIEDLQ
jgi:tetratricopeptide (TPR) repeat protein